MKWKKKKYRNNDVGGSRAYIAMPIHHMRVRDCVSTESVSQDLSHKIHRYRDAVHTKCWFDDGVLSSFFPLFFSFLFSPHFVISHIYTYLYFVIFGTKTCVTINFKLFQCFKNSFFLALVAFIFWPSILFIISTSWRRSYSRRSCDLWIPTHISHYCSLQIFFCK